MTLKELYAKATGKTFIFNGDALILETRIKHGVERTMITRGLSSNEAALIVALHNLYPAMEKVIECADTLRTFQTLQYVTGRPDEDISERVRMLDIALRELKEKEGGDERVI